MNAVSVIARKESAKRLRSASTLTTLIAAALVACLGCVNASGGISGRIAEMQCGRFAGIFAAAPSLPFGREPAVKIDGVTGAFAALLLFLPVIAVSFIPPALSRGGRNGRLETLLTAPVSDAEVVAGGFFSALWMSALTVACALVCAALFIDVDSGAAIRLACSFFGLLLLASCWISFGILTGIGGRRSPAAWMFPLLVSMGVTSALYISDFARWSVFDMPAGVFDTRPLAQTLLATSFLLFCAVRRLESRRWAA